MKKIFFVIMLMTLTTCLSSGQKTDNCDTNLVKVYDFLNKIDFTYKVVDYKDFKGFDFTAFKPIEGEISREDYFKIGFDEQNKIVEINHYETELRLTNFRMPVYHSDDFIVFGYEGFWDDNERENEGHFKSGFFLHQKNIKKNYFINTSSQFAKIPKASVNYIGIFPVNKLSDISAVIYLNDNFFPEKMLRISKGTIVAGSEFYYDDDGVLMYENLLFFNIPEFGFDLELNTQGCLDDHLTLFKKLDRLAARVYPRIQKKFYSIPLWVWGGAHDYISDNDIQR